MKRLNWTPETLGRELAEIGVIDSPPCHICAVAPICDAKQTYLVCRDFAKLLDGLNEPK